MIRAIAYMAKLLPVPVAKSRLHDSLSGNGSRSTSASALG